MAANQGKTGARPGLPGQTLGAAAPSTNSSQGPATAQQQHQPHQYRNDRRKDKGQQQQQQQHVNMGSDIEVGGSRDRSKSPWTTILTTANRNGSTKKKLVFTIFCKTICLHNTQQYCFFLSVSSESRLLSRNGCHWRERNLKEATHISVWIPLSVLLFSPSWETNNQSTWWTGWTPFLLNFPHRSLY